jgi:hypothetical protein
MQNKLLPCVFAALVTFAFSAFAQFDAGGFATDLRAKYGPPLVREVFAIPAGEMAVDYATSGHVCRINLPGIGPEEGHSGVSSPKGIDDFLLKLLPLTMRGKKLRQMVIQSGVVSVGSTEYENVTISAASNGQGPTGVTVIFTNEKC